MNPKLGQRAKINVGFKLAQSSYQISSLIMRASSLVKEESFYCNSAVEREHSLEAISLFCFFAHTNTIFAHHLTILSPQYHDPPHGSQQRRYNMYINADMREATCDHTCQLLRPGK